MVRPIQQKHHQHLQTTSLHHSIQNNQSNLHITTSLHISSQTQTSDFKATTLKMYTTTLLTAVLATLAAAAPATNNLAARDDTYYGVSLRVRTTDAFTKPAVYGPAPIEINKLTSLGNVSASELSFDPSIAINVDIDQIECRAYKDAAGVIPGSAPFNVKTPAELSTNLVEVGSVLCYVVTEAEKF